MTEPLDGRPRSVEAASGLRVPEDAAERFRERERWRDTSVLHDLLRVAAGSPDDPAIVVYTVQDGRTTTVCCAELASQAGRSAAELTSLGVRRGDRVAFQLPNWREVAALTLACCWTGAIAVPLLSTPRALELERMPEAVRAQVCVVVDSWEGYGCAAALAEMSARLPWLRHGVVHGERVPSWAVDFREYLLRTRTRRASPCRSCRPARPSTGSAWCCPPPAPPGSARRCCTPRTSCARAPGRGRARSSGAGPPARCSAPRTPSPDPRACCTAYGARSWPGHRRLPGRVGAGAVSRTAVGGLGHADLPGPLPSSSSSSRGSAGGPARCPRCGP